MAEEQDYGHNQDEENGTSALDLLREDHQRVQELFEQFENADARSRARIAEQALDELEIHTKLEEGLIYPAIRAEMDEEELMDQALEEHHVATFLIKELRKMAPRDARFSAKFKVLAESVRHHIEEEESQIFPQAEEMDIDFAKLGEKAMQRKEKLAGTGSRTPQRGRQKKQSSGRSTRSRKRKAA